jgi:hypothetical protein
MTNDAQSVLTLANTLSLNAALLFAVVQLWKELQKERAAHIDTLRKIAKVQVGDESDNA